MYTRWTEAKSLAVPEAIKRGTEAVQGPAVIYGDRSHWI